MIGTNKQCSAETVAQVVEDFIAGRLAEPVADREKLDALIAERRPEYVDYKAGRPSTSRNAHAGRRPGGRA